MARGSPPPGALQKDMFKVTGTILYVLFTLFQSLSTLFRLFQSPSDPFQARDIPGQSTTDFLKRVAGTPRTETRGV